MYITNILIAILFLINIVSFCIVANDKRKSVRGGEVDRTPEGLLFFLASVFGAIGVYVAMIVFRHKTRKWYFQFGIPLLILENIATLYLFVCFRL